ARTRSPRHHVLCHCLHCWHALDSGGGSRRPRFSHSVAAGCSLVHGAVGHCRGCALPEISRYRRPLPVDAQRFWPLAWLSLLHRLLDRHCLLVPSAAMFYMSAGIYALGPSYAWLAGSRVFLLSISLVAIWIALGTNLIGMQFGKWTENIGACATWLL